MEKQEIHWLFREHCRRFWLEISQLDPIFLVSSATSFIGSLVSCRVGFQQNLGQKSVMDPSCHHNFWGHQQPQGHNKQEPTTFLLPYGSNKQHCMDKEESQWLCGVMPGWFSAKLGSNCQNNFWGHQQPQQGHNKQEPTTFILPYGSNKQHCMDKKDFH
jgi:hypothetical protein